MLQNINAGLKKTSFEPKIIDKRLALQSLNDTDFSHYNQDTPTKMPGFNANRSYDERSGKSVLQRRLRTGQILVDQVEIAALIGYAPAQATINHRFRHERHTPGTLILDLCNWGEVIELELLDHFASAAESIVTSYARKLLEAHSSASNKLYEFAKILSLIQHPVELNQFYSWDYLVDADFSLNHAITGLENLIYRGFQASQLKTIQTLPALTHALINATLCHKRYAPINGPTNPKFGSHRRSTYLAEAIDVLAPTFVEPSNHKDPEKVQIATREFLWAQLGESLLSQKCPELSYHDRQKQNRRDYVRFSNKNIESTVLFPDRPGWSFYFNHKRTGDSIEFNSRSPRHWLRDSDVVEIEFSEKWQAKTLNKTLKIERVHSGSAQYRVLFDIPPRPPRLLKPFLIIADYILNFGQLKKRGDTFQGRISVSLGENSIIENCVSFGEAESIINIINCSCIIETIVIRRNYEINHHNNERDKLLEWLEYQQHHYMPTQEYTIQWIE